MSARALLGELRRLGVELEADGEMLHVDAPAGIMTEELREALTENKSELLTLCSLNRDEGLPFWDEDEACQLIKDAWIDLCEQHQKAGKPAFDPSAIMNSPPYDRMCEACRAEDMGELRRAVEAFRVVGTEEFRDRKGGMILVAGYLRRDLEDERLRSEVSATEAGQSFQKTAHVSGGTARVSFQAGLVPVGFRLSGPTTCKCPSAC
jgi:hypothetical protein